jgi:hypothetical protein
MPIQHEQKLREVAQRATDVPKQIHQDGEPLGPSGVKVTALVIAALPGIWVSGPALADYAADTRELAPQFKTCSAVQYVPAEPTTDVPVGVDVRNPHHILVLCTRANGLGGSIVVRYEVFRTTSGTWVVGNEYPVGGWQDKGELP